MSLPTNKPCWKACRTSFFAQVGWTHWRLFSHYTSYIMFPKPRSSWPWWKKMRLKAKIYFDDIPAPGVSRDYMIRLIAAIIEAIFTVCGQPQIELQQCPPSLEKWFKMVIDPIQIVVLGLYVDTNKMTIGIPKNTMTKWSPCWMTAGPTSVDSFELVICKN